MTQQIDTCIKFKRNSWHRKLHDVVYGEWKLQRTIPELKLDEDNNAYYDYKKVDREISLCPYMRRIVWACVLFPFLIIWRNLPEKWQYHEDEAKGIVVYALLCLFAHVLINLVWDVWYAWALGFFGGIGIICGFWGLLIGLEKLKDKLSGKIIIHLPSGGLLRTYLESKHSKICPCIEFVDDQKNNENRENE